MKNKNDITGDIIKTKTGGQQAYADNWDKIFGKPKPPTNVKIRKVTPAHAITRVEEDKTKRIPRKEKYKSINILVE